MGVLNMLVTSAVVGAAGSVRAGAGMAELTVRRTPSLLVLGVRATLGAGPDAGLNQAVFRDELLALLDDTAEIAWLQARRARDQLGLRTSPSSSGPRPPAQEGAGAHNGDPHRHHRVKA